MNNHLAAALLGLAVIVGARAAPSERVTVADAVYARSRLDEALAPARDRVQFEAWSARHRSIEENPFLRLSLGAQRRFLESLDDPMMRLGKAPETDDLEAELTLSQAVRLLAVIGRQTIGVYFMPDIRVVSEEDKIAEAWRRTVLEAGEGE